jgi:hypothetical protein
MLEMKKELESQVKFVEERFKPSLERTDELFF